MMMMNNDYIEFIFSETKKVFEEVAKEVGSEVKIGPKPNNEKQFSQKIMGFRIKKIGHEISLNLIIESDETGVIYLAPERSFLEVEYHSGFKNRREYEKELVIIAAFLRRHMM